MTITDRSTVIGVFVNRALAELAVGALEQAGFTDKQLGFIRRSEKTTTDEAVADTLPTMATGVATEGVLGGILGTAAALFIPGVGPAIAGGILAATLGGAASGVPIMGLFGTLIELGVPGEEARSSQVEFEAGRTLVIVRAENRRQAARDIIHRYGGYDATTRR